MHNLKVKYCWAVYICWKINSFNLCNLKIQWPLHQLRYRGCHICSLDLLRTSWVIGEFIEKDYCVGFTRDRPANYFIFNFFAPLFPYLSVTEFSSKQDIFTSYFLQLCRLLSAINEVCQSHLVIRLMWFCGSGSVLSGSYGTPSCHVLLCPVLCHYSSFASLCTVTLTGLSNSKQVSGQTWDRTWRYGHNIRCVCIFCTCDSRSCTVSC